MDTKHEIAGRTEALFLKYGIRSVTMDDIARELGISKKTLYQHFDNKDDLVETVVKNHMQREREMARQIQAEATDALEEMFLMAKMYIEELEAISASAVFDLQKYYGKLWAECMQRQDEFDVDFIVKNIQRGRKEGLYRKDMEAEIVAKIFNKSTLMVLNEMADSNSKFSRRELIKQLHDYHVHSLATTVGLETWKKLLKQL